MTNQSSASVGASDNAASPSIKFRSATGADAEWIDQLQALAFGPGRFARAAFRVRERFEIDPELSLIAEIEGVPISSVSMTPISLSGVNGYLLGPLATDPAHRAKGVGRALVREVTTRVLTASVGDFVLLVGDESYYGPLGFIKTKPNAIIFPGPVDPARILVHSRDPADAQDLHGPIAAFGAT